MNVLVSLISKIREFEACQSLSIIYITINCAEFLMSSLFLIFGTPKNEVIFLLNVIQFTVDMLSIF